MNPYRSLARSVALLALLAASAVGHAQIAVLSSTVEEKVVAVGSQYSANIVIANPGKTDVTVRLYQNDYLFSADGISQFCEPGSTGRSNAKWLTLQAARVVVRAGSQITVPYSVVVPAADSLRGTYWSTIMVEPVTDDTPAAATAKPSVAIGAIMRYAIQVATHIQSTGTRTVHFDNAAAAKSATGVATLDVDVTDSGERGYRPSIWVEVYDAQGVLRAKGRQERGLLFPGTSLHQHFDLGMLPPGTYKAVLFADTGENSVFASQYTISY